MLIYGHRGAAAHAPENTLVSFRAAIESGADGIEIDLRLTTDGAIVLIHEDDVARITGRAGSISEMSLEQVRALDAAASFPGWPGPERVPTLQEALDVIAGDVALCAELKPVPLGGDRWSGVPVAEAAAPLLEGVPDLTVSSFDHSAVDRARALLPGVRTALTVTRLVPAISGVHAAIEAGHPECHIPVEHLDEAVLRAARDAGIAVLVWTVNDAEQAAALAAMGVDGIFSDDPAGVRPERASSG